jgi:hypothetical protein
MLPRFSSSALRSACAFFSLVLVLTSGVAALAQTPVTTEHNDTFRSGANLSETILTPNNVNVNTFGKLFSDAIDGYAVGQPLYMPGLKFSNGTTHNVVYVTTQHDSVFAFDADSAQAPLWQVSFINPSAGITSVPITSYGCPGTHFSEIGIMSTPVIDTTTNVLYLVAKTEENGAFIYRLHGLSLTTGQDVITPVVLSATATTTKGTLQFTAAYQMQRASLLLSNGTIYIGFASNGCDTYAYHGWLLAYDEATFTQVGALVLTPNGTKGGIWQSGAAPAADTDGTIFLATANGTFDANTGGSDYGDSILHISAASVAKPGLTILDYFTPYNQSTLATSDLDLGSGGVILLPNQTGAVTKELFQGGKQGTGYLINRANMGGYNSAGDTQIVQEITAASTGHIDSVPTYWNGNVYVSGNNDYVRAYSLANGMLSPQAVMQTPVLFNNGGPGILSVSSNSQLTTGVLWAILHNGTLPTLYAFSAANLSNELYTTRQAKSSRDEMTGVARFSAPTVTNGHVYMGGTKNLMVYGLLPVISATSGNNQSAYVGTVVTLSVSANDAYLGTPLNNVPVNCKDGGVGGVFASATVNTNSSGAASFSYTLPTKAKSVTINCTTLGYTTAVFSETAVEGPPSRITITAGNNQTVATGPTQLPTPLTIIVYDRYSRGVPGVTVTFSDNGAGGVVGSPTTTTDSTGHASTTYITPANKGRYVVTVSVSGLTSGSFHVTVN